MNTPVTLKPASLGSISHGTLRTEDLIEAFTHELEWQIRRNGEYFSRPENFSERDRLNNIVETTWEDFYDDNGDFKDDDTGEAEEWLNETLFDALNVFAPPYCMFGSHQGDGSDFGYWPDWFCIDELETVEGSDEAKELGADCKSVNDHGNVTVWSGEGKAILEVV